ncbi:MAG: hypothetical protein EU517_01460, partial [Promethearchaeota archaeon]
MEYFFVDKKNEETFVHFYNKPWPIYSSKNEPDLLFELEIKPNDFVNKANAIFSKYQISIPENFPKHGLNNKITNGKKFDEFPVNDFIKTIYFCSIIEEEYGIDSSQILKNVLILPNSNKGIHHACSISIVALDYLKQGFDVSIPSIGKTQSKSNLIINNLKCIVNTILDNDWEVKIDPETEFSKPTSRGEDLCYDIGKFMGKKHYGYKGILEADVILVDLDSKSFGSLIDDMMTFNNIDGLLIGLPEPKKYRIIFFS